jgi:hypothetical protein
MKADKVNSWLSLGANIGVVTGLFLVAFQINQDAELTKAELFSQHTDSRREWNQAMMGNSPMDVVAKSIESPRDLTLAELQMMDMYYVAAINELRRLEVLKQAGLDVGTSVEGLQSFYFGSNFAKAWYQEYGQHELRAIHDKINSVDSDWVVSFFDRVLARVDDTTGQTLSRDAVAE